MIYKAGGRDFRNPSPYVSLPIYTVHASQMSHSSPKAFPQGDPFHAENKSLTIHWHAIQTDCHLRSVLESRFF